MFQSFATLDIISQGREEIVVGRGSAIEAYPLFGYNLDDYDATTAEVQRMFANQRKSGVSLCKNDTSLIW